MIASAAIAAAIIRRAGLMTSFRSFMRRKATRRSNAAIGAGFVAWPSRTRTGGKLNIKGHAPIASCASVTQLTCKLAEEIPMAVFAKPHKKKNIHIALEVGDIDEALAFYG